MSRVQFNPSLVAVDVITAYLPDHSNPEDGQYTFAYTITISNASDVPVQLLSRHWVIQDATGQTREVRGPGVVGEQPVLEPGDSFEYTSGCPLNTPFGSMEGRYQMVTESGEEFEAEIARFELREPGAIH